ncbi:hypothetical protein OUZ56_012183 [Daphnia magna]|uniref:Uncharacterized protein n=1 Tax=Daphnia magna TaxID=35525 RepID=A0ABQ9Z2C1_9CRUS|nr:hypothetical protein OUZ56_012183 [Daphnia magna]
MDQFHSKEDIPPSAYHFQTAGRARLTGRAETENRFETTDREQSSSTTSINAQRVDYLKRVRTAAG